jgi:hypothetical protein
MGDNCANTEAAAGDEKRGRVNPDGDRTPMPLQVLFLRLGGAIGQRMRAFWVDRLRGELELVGRHRIETDCLCDSKVGIRPAAGEFLEAVIHAHDRYGNPQAAETVTKPLSEAVYVYGSC